MQVERLKLLLSGPQAEKLREEFEDTIASELRNPNTISAYLYAWRNFADWCREQKLDPLKVRAAHIGAWIAQHKGSPRTQRQHLSAVRRPFRHLSFPGAHRDQSRSAGQSRQIF